MSKRARHKIVHMLNKAQNPTKPIYGVRSHTDGQQVCEKVFNITNLERMQIKSTRCHLTPVRMAASKRQELTSIGEDVEKRNSLYTVVGDVNWCSPCGKQYRGVSESQKENNHMIQQLQF